VFDAMLLCTIAAIVMGGRCSGAARRLLFAQSVVSGHLRKREEETGKQLER
jgi:hypothetical protein